MYCNPWIWTGYGRSSPKADFQNITPDSRFAGRRLREADVRRDALVVLIRRAGQDVIPDGGTVIEPGDTLVLYTHG